jgi:hypothetical protein
MDGYTTYREFRNRKTKTVYAFLLVGGAVAYVLFSNILPRLYESLQKDSLEGVVENERNLKNIE